MNAKKMMLQTMTQLPIRVLLTFSLPFLNYNCQISTKVFNWFGNNHMKDNLSKCHLLPSSKSF